MTFRASSYDQTGMTATGSFTSSAGGTVSASWAETASFALNAADAASTTGSYTGTFTGEHLGDVVDVTSITGSLTGTLAGSASYALTSSHALRAKTVYEPVAEADHATDADTLNTEAPSFYLDSDNFTGTKWTDLTDGGQTLLHEHRAEDINAGTFGAGQYEFPAGVTASFTTSAGGEASVSWAEVALTSLNDTSTGSFTGSFIGEHLGDVVDVTSITGSLTGTLEGSASYAQTASYLNTSALASVYVGKFGADSYDGLSPERPKLTIGSALTAGASLLTGGIEGVRIEVLDGGTYPEGVDLISGIHLHAPAATLVGEMVLSTGASALVNTHYAATSSTSTVLLSGSIGRGHYRSQLLDTRGTEGDLSPVIGLVNGTGGGILLTHVDVLLVGSGSAGIADAVDGFGHIHFFCQDLYLAGDGAVGIGPFSEGSNLIGWIDHILETGGPDETIAIKSNVANSIIKLVCAEIITDTAYEITAGDVHLACPRISGSLTGLPVALISDAGISISGSISASSGQLTEGADTRIAAVSWSAGAPTATDVAPTGTLWIDTSTPLTASLANAVNVGGTHCAVRMSGDQAIATGTDTSASLDTTINDPGSNWDTDLATYTVPEDGVYLMTFTARMQTMADGTYWRVWIQKDGNAIAWHSQKAQNGQANYINVSTMMRLSTNDTINFWVRHVHGSDRDLGGGTAGGSHSRTVAEIVKLGEY